MILSRTDGHRCSRPMRLTAYRIAQANIVQLAVMKSYTYEVLRAPFDGTVRARFVDVGALVRSSVTNKTSNQPVLTIADMSKRRVDVYVEQSDVPYVHVGDVADVADAANPARHVAPCEGLHRSYFRSA
jgi:multidrug resistance efflux pump